MHRWSPLTLLCLLLGLYLGNAPTVYTMHDITAEAKYDDGAAQYLSIEKWLQQKDMNLCLSDTPADILFAVDGSESVTLTDFHLVVKSLLVDTVSRLEIGENLVQVGVLVFSSQVTQTIPIGKYSNKLDLLQAIGRLAYDGGYTSFESVIEGCIAELGRRTMDVSNASDSDFDSDVEIAERKRVVIFVSDGRISNSFGVYIDDLLRQLHSKVTAVMTLGLQSSDHPMLTQLVSDPALVFDPTTYPDFQTSLHTLLNMRCSGSCYKYESQEENVRRVITTLVQYLNYLISNFASYYKQKNTLADYSRSVNESVVSMELDIVRTCNTEDNGLLERIITLQDRISTETNGSNFAGSNIDSYIGEMIRSINIIQKEIFDQTQTLATEKTKLEGTKQLEERLVADFEANLKSKTALSKAQSESLAALKTRIESYRTEISSISKKIAGYENDTVGLSSQLTRHEELFASLQTQLTKLTLEHTGLLAAESGGQVYMNGVLNKAAMCETHLRNGYTVLFAIRCGSGASFESLYTREDVSFSDVPFTGLTTQQLIYKSSYLRQMHSMGYYSTVINQFLDSNGNVLGSVTWDLNQFELRSQFIKVRVTSSFPWVASYVNSIYSSSLILLRPKTDTEFYIIAGDLDRYRVTGNCADIVGVFLVMTTPHRCYPEATTFPQIYISVSPFGGPIVKPVAEFRLLTDRLPSIDRPMPTRTTNSEQLSEILLYAKSGAGFLHSMLLTSRYTPAAQLLDVDDLSQLSRHYKSSMLANLNLENYRAIKLELFDRSGRVLASLRFEGPFNSTTNSKLFSFPSETGVSPNPEKWDWFQAKYLTSAQPFDLERLRQSRFNFYNGLEFFQIGEHLGVDNCSERLYFLTVLDGATSCQCFSKDVATPAIFISNDAKPHTCDRLIQVDSLRLTGELVRPSMSARIVISSSVARSV